MRIIIQFNIRYKAWIVAIYKVLSLDLNIFCMSDTRTTQIDPIIDFVGKLAALNVFAI